MTDGLPNIAQRAVATASGVESHRSYYSKFDKELNKTVKIYFSYLTKAAYAVDGSSWSGDLRYTCIPKSSNTWLKIDFETVKVVHHFYFHGTTRIDFDIFVGNKGSNAVENTLCLQFNPAEGIRQRCGHPLTGQFVWIVSRKRFCVEEVLIFGEFYY